MDKQEENFGLPKVDNTPMGIVGMEGNFFRGLSGNKTSRPKWLRISIIIFSVVFFLIPGLAFVYNTVTLYSDIIKDNGIIVFVVELLIGLLISSAGIVGIKANIKK